MTRAILIALLAVLASCSSPQACGDDRPKPTAQTTVPEHTHARTEQRQSCAAACSPGNCASSYGIDEQRPLPCDAKPTKLALCVCTAP
jgi:hypothetical protein